MDELDIVVELGHVLSNRLRFAENEIAMSNSNFVPLAFTFLQIHLRNI